MNFQNKVVIVTGGSSGIGAETAIQFSKESAQVVIVGRNQVKLNSVSETCQKYGKAAFVIVADFEKEDEVRTIVDTTIKHFGRLDILVNNAGISSIKNSILDENVLEVYDKIMTVNLRAVIQITNLAIPFLIKTGGNIVNVSSVVARMPVNKLIMYATSKAALDHFSRCIAMELAEHGVRVNVVNPGLVRTDIIMNLTGLNKETSDAIFSSLEDRMPLRGVSDSEDIAYMIIFLSSDKAKSITGGLYTVDRGSTLIGGQHLSAS